MGPASPRRALGIERFCDARSDEKDTKIAGPGGEEAVAGKSPDAAGDEEPLAAPAVEITSARFGGRERVDESSPQARYEGRTFRVEFAAMMFRDSDPLECRYRLSGLEKEFTLTRQREARYASLPTGSHTFEVLYGSKRARRAWCWRWRRCCCSRTSGRCAPAPEQETGGGGGGAHLQKCNGAAGIFPSAGRVGDGDLR